MSIASTVIELVAPKKPKPSNAVAPGIAAKLAAAEAILTNLETQFGKHALAAETEGEAGELALKDFLLRVDAAKANVETLRAAHQAALNQDAEMDRERIASIHATKVNAMKAHLQARDRAAAKLSVALENATIAFREMLDEGEAAATSSPVLIPGYYHVGYRKISQAVLAELWRIGSGPENRSGGHNTPFPGASWAPLSGLAPEHGNRQFLPGQMADPEIWPPLLDRMKLDAKQIEAFVKGEPMPALPEPEKPAIPTAVAASAPAYKDDGTIPPPSVLTPPIEVPEPPRIVSNAELAYILKDARYWRQGADDLIGQYRDGVDDNSIPQGRRVALAQALEALPKREHKFEGD